MHQMRPAVSLALAAALQALLWALPAVCAGEFQLRTNDGQVVRGEYLGTDGGVVKLRTRYGVLQIASKDVQSMTAVEDAAPPAPRVGEPKADAPAEPEPPPPPPPPLTFPEVPEPNFRQLEAARMKEVSVPEPDKNQRQEIIRLVRNFSGTNPTNKRATVRTLQDYGPVAYSFIASAYTYPGDFDVRIGLLEALAVPGRPFTATILANAHRDAFDVGRSIAGGPPPVPPPYVSKRDRDRPQTRDDLLAYAARNILDIEQYASTAGGPFNCLFLLNVYRDRYTAEKQDVLLMDIARDRARLAATAADASRSRSSWQPADRVTVAELVLPWLFRGNEDQAALAKDLLKKLLPTGYPKWDAPEDDWVKWWEKAREKMLSSRR
jgi:hypothetical protein